MPGRLTAVMSRILHELDISLICRSAHARCASTQMKDVIRRVVTTYFRCDGLGRRNQCDSEQIKDRGTLHLERFLI